MSLRIVGKECLVKLCRSAMGELGKLNGAGDPPNSSSYPVGALRLNIPIISLILAFKQGQLMVLTLSNWEY